MFYLARQIFFICRFTMSCSGKEHCYGVGIEERAAHAVSCLRRAQGVTATWSPLLVV